MDNVVWVTGGSQGLGAAIASAVPDPDALVINVSRRSNPFVENFLCDLSDETEWARLAAHFTATLARHRPRRAVLVNNAVTHHGVGLVGAQSPAVVRDQLTVNLTAPLAMCSAFIDTCASAGSVKADMVLISSVNAVEPLPGFATYCAAKAGLEQWVRTVWDEPRSGTPAFRAVCVRPGSVDTPGLRQAAGLTGALAPLAEEVATSLAEGGSADPATVAGDLWSAVWHSWPTAPVVSLG